MFQSVSRKSGHGKTRQPCNGATRRHGATIRAPVASKLRYPSGKDLRPLRLRQRDVADCADELLHLWLTMWAGQGLAPTRHNSWIASAVPMK
mmetsp:Transcript_49242/g.114470  ORF Transcript_49242/g.114470 Transcript_49242/m.114470 type:complete len:92 (-) Transcript_49242:93-368(-)